MFEHFTNVQCHKFVYNFLIEHIFKYSLKFGYVYIEYDQRTLMYSSFTCQLYPPPPQPWGKVGAYILIYLYLTVTLPPEAEAAQPMWAKF
jgi:hypothetical protein